jgi:hypothetical protein
MLRAEAPPEYLLLNQDGAVKKSLVWMMYDKPDPDQALADAEAIKKALKKQLLKFSVATTVCIAVLVTVIIIFNQLPLLVTILALALAVLGASFSLAHRDIAKFRSYEALRDKYGIVKDFLFWLNSLAEDLGVSAQFLLALNEEALRNLAVSRLKEAFVDSYKKELEVRAAAATQDPQTLRQLAETWDHLRQKALRLEKKFYDYQLHGETASKFWQYAKDTVNAVLPSPAQH